MIAKEALAADRCVIIGLQSTGEAYAGEMRSDEMNDWVSAPKVALRNLVKKHFPRDADGVAANEEELRGLLSRVRGKRGGGSRTVGSVRRRRVPVGWRSTVGRIDASCVMHGSVVALLFLEEYGR
jgi:hypothetical protein